MVRLWKQEALYRCHELWYQLYMNPDKSKGDWPRWKDNGGDIEHVNAHCFACSYNQENTFWKCGINCIVPIFRYVEHGCNNPDSPYELWEESIDPEENARLISDSSYQEYKRLGGWRDELTY